MRPIDADELKTAFPCGETVRTECVRATIDHMPTVDAVSAVHGQWIMMGGMKPPEYHHHHQCSICESYAPMRMPYGSREALSPYCPACGAKMDLEEQNN